MNAPQRPKPLPRSAFPVFRTITTRWMDNDVYGHVNNVVYYSWFDTAVNAYLIEHGALDIHAGSTIGLVIETQCNYFAPLAFPQDVHAGIRVAHMGTSSVRYEVGLFAARALLLQRVILSMCMWTGTPGGQSQFLKRCAKCWSLWWSEHE
jgi:acyl-CoA thioester hydrolase